MNAMQFESCAGQAYTRASWHALREFASWMRDMYGGTYVVNVGEGCFGKNFGAVVDDFGDLVRVDK